MYVFCFFLLNDIMLIDKLHDYARVILYKWRKLSDVGRFSPKSCGKCEKRVKKLGNTIFLY